MLLTDGAAHRDLRRPAARFLAPRAVTLHRERVERMVDAALERLPRKGVVDFASQVAEPIVTAVARTLLGLPATHDRDLARWSSAIIRMTDPLTPTTVRARVENALRECRAFVDDARRVGALEPSGLAAQVLADKGSLSPQDGLANAVLLLVAAIDTTVGQLCSSMFHLLRHPAEFARLRGDPPRAAGSLAELVRYDSPVQILTRRITADVSTPVGTMRTGEKLMLLLGAANRDPDRYRDPDRLWLMRPDVEPLAFGAGPHFCVGVHLAQLTMGSVLRGFILRYPHPRLADPEPAWRPSVVARRLETLRLNPDSQ
ncbi:cytochrome P450 [Streptomyces sp. NPDC026206]|uniref:cytochrome P450 n=1 Tax=Streptomyces sp. NPDC026206 TaxID=3157089 RepID=UPI0033E9D3C0